jgi:hypothetical protein
MQRTGQPSARLCAATHEGVSSSCTGKVALDGNPAGPCCIVRVRCATPPCLRFAERGTVSAAFQRVATIMGRPRFRNVSVLAGNGFEAVLRRAVGARVLPEAVSPPTSARLRARAARSRRADAPIAAARARATDTPLRAASDGGTHNSLRPSRQSGVPAAVW